MRHSFFILFFAVMFATGALAEVPADPFAGIHYYLLPNGLRVVLFPDPGATKVLVQVGVDAGQQDESSAEIGVAHLIEHVLFRREGHLADTYLDMLQKEGAETNGMTGTDQTIYYAALPADRTDWLIRLFGQMFRRQSFDSDTVEKAKSEILLEYDSPKRDQDFKEEEDLDWLLENEFGVAHPTPSHRVLVSSTRNLGVSEVADFFRRYYHPRNLTLFVVGGFDERAIRSRIESVFGGLDSGTRTAREELAPVPNPHPFIRRLASDTAPRVMLGTKFWSADPQDELVLHAYLENLALRLMRHLRSEGGQTYTVSPLFQMDTRKIGVGVITFETTSAAYLQALNYVRDRIAGETRGRALTSEDLAGVRELYFRRLRAQEHDIHSLMDLAQTDYAFRLTYGTSDSPFTVFRKISDGEFRRRLGRLFAPENEIRVLLEPPLFFPHEGEALCLVSAIVGILLSYRLLHRRENGRGPFRFFCKMHYSGATILMIGFRLLCAAGFWALLSLPLFLLGDALAEKSYLVRDYLRWAYLIATGELLFFHALGQIPRRISVSADRLVIQGLVFSSQVIPLDQISEIKTCGVGEALRALPWRSRLTHLGPWQPGVLIQLRNGRGYYLGFRAPALIAMHLRALLPVRPAAPHASPPPLPQSAAAGG